MLQLILFSVTLRYNENSSGSSAEEEKVEEEVTVEDEEEEREEVEEGEGHADVETIEKILRERVGRKGGKLLFCFVFYVGRGNSKFVLNGRLF